MKANNIRRRHADKSMRASYIVQGWTAYFIPKCEKCFRYVKAKPCVLLNEKMELDESENRATCSKCGRTKMIFECWEPPPYWAEDMLI